MVDAIAMSMRNWNLIRRVTVYYVMLSMLGIALYIVGYGRVGGVFFGLFMGILLSGITYDFRPYSFSWSTVKSISLKSMHKLLLVSSFFILAYLFYIKEGALIKNDFSFIDQASGLILISFGVIFAGVILGKGRFAPRS